MSIPRIEIVYTISQQQGFYENGATAIPQAASINPPMAAPRGNGGRAPEILQANLAVFGNPKVVYAVIAAEEGRPGGGGGRGGPRRRNNGVVGGLEVYRLRRPLGARHGNSRHERHRPASRGYPPSGTNPAAAIWPRSRWTPEQKVVSPAPPVWRTEDGGLSWTAVRGAPGGDDYQKSWVNPNNPNIIGLVSDQGAVMSAIMSVVEQLVHATYGHVSRHRRQRVSLPAVRRPTGFGLAKWPRHGRWSTIGIRWALKSTAWPRPTRRIPTWCTAAK